MPHLRLLLTSRGESDIRHGLSLVGVEEVSIQTEAVDGDIRKFIKEHLRDDLKLRKWSAHHDAIESALIEGAHGM